MAVMSLYEVLSLLLVIVRLCGGFEPLCGSMWCFCVFVFDNSSPSVSNIMSFLNIIW